MKIFIGILATVLVLVLTYRLWLPKAFVVLAGKSGFSFENVELRAVTSSNEALNEMGEELLTESPNKFVSLDLRFPYPLIEIDYYDFQLVKRNDYELGHEENVGDNLEEDSFAAIPLTPDWDVASVWDEESDQTFMRLTFKVPEGSTEGYLFYWGKYLGPIQF